MRVAVVYLAQRDVRAPSKPSRDESGGLSHVEEHRAPDARVRDVSANARLATHAEQPPLEIRLDREDGVVGHRRAAV